MTNQAGDTSRLLSHSARKRESSSTEHLICLLVALPSAALNAIAAVSGSEVKLGELNSLADLKSTLAAANGATLFYGTLALLGSEATFYFLNQRYFFPACHDSLALLKLNYQGLYLRDPFVNKYTLLAKDIFFAWSIFTSLIFAEIGGQALSFFGKTGIAAGFTLSALVYFSTRYASANAYFFAAQQPANPQRLETPAEQTSTSINNKNVHFDLFAKALGWGAVLLTTLPIFSSFIPVSTQGLELISNSSIGGKSNYQNAGSILFGIFATSLTWFFYELNIKDFFQHLLTTSHTFKYSIQENRKDVAIESLGLTFLAGFISYLSSIGFKYVADTAVDKNYLSYLGDDVSKFVPGCLLFGVMTMLWSHLQELINQRAEQKMSNPVFRVA